MDLASRDILPMSPIQSPIGPGAVTAPSSAPVASALSRSGDARADARTAAVELESLFVSLLLQQMRQSIGGEGLFPGDPSDTYGGLFDLYLGRQLAESGALGISGMVSKYLEAEQSA